MNPLTLRWSILYLLFATTNAFSHEPWLMTPDQLAYWKAQPTPLLFSSWNIINVSVLSLAIILIIVFHSLALLYEKKIYTTYTQFGSLTLRILTAASLLIAAFGLIPRVGFPMYTPTLFTPDIPLINLPYASLIKWFEVFIAIGLIIGKFIPLFALLLLTLTFIACYFFPLNMILYAGYFIGISFFLLIHTQTPLRMYTANFILRFSTGVAFILSGAYKVMHPMIDIGLLTINQAFTFTIDYDTFTLLMAIVEISAGIFIVSGVFIRLVALGLFVPFIYLSYLLDENIFAHCFIYGILIYFILNGSTRYSIKKKRIYHT